MAEQDHILEANLVLTKKGSTALTPLSNKWWYPGGRGPASLSLDMVACARTKPQSYRMWFPCDHDHHDHYLSPW